MAKTATRGPTRWWNGVPSTTEAHGREIENNVNNFYSEAHLQALPLEEVETEHRKITNSLVWKS